MSQPEVWKISAKGGGVISGPANMALLRLITLRSALGLFCDTGIRPSRNVHPLKIVKTEFGFKGNKLKVYAQLDDYVRAVQAGKAPITGNDGNKYIMQQTKIRKAKV